MKYRIVVADVDGTLIAPGANDKLMPSERLINAVKKANELGVLISMATARSLDKVDGLVKNLGLNSQIILANGASIYDCLVQKYIFNSYIPQKTIEEIIAVLKQYPFTFYLDTINARYEYSPKAIIPLKKIVKIVVLHIQPREAQQLFEVVYNNNKVRVTKSISGINPVKESIHITNFDATKENALRKIIDLNGIRTEQVLTIGDSYNDYYLMNASGFKVAMGNSVPEILAIADYIAPSYEEDGVAQVLEKFILNGNE